MEFFVQNPSFNLVYGNQFNRFELSNFANIDFQFAWTCRRLLEFSVRALPPPPELACSSSAPRHSGTDWILALKTSAFRAPFILCSSQECHISCSLEKTSPA